LKLSDLHTAIHEAGIKGSEAERHDNGTPNQEIEVTSLHYDTRNVRPGGLFVAIEGFSSDGHRYIQDAVEKGAVAVVSQKPSPAPIPVFQVSDSRKALAVLADRFFGSPSRQLTIIGITGTNGKTTTAYLIENILLAAGFHVGVIGTVNCRYKGKMFKNPVTTPESLDLQRILAEMKSEGVTHVVLEVSSHAIDLSRIEGCRLDMGVFTNLTQDHLDYHGDMDHYWACKKRLFTEYLGHEKKAMAVINIDNLQGRELVSDLTYPCITTGRSTGSMVHSESMTSDFDGIRGIIASPQGSVRFDSPLVGKHNLENILSAAGVGSALGLPPEAIQTGINRTLSVPGRLERVPGSPGIPVFVDFAHTPDALENVLEALKRLTPERIICIFGCGGNRDRVKRPLMGQIAAASSHLTIVTSDNPRSEKPGDIIDQILPGIRRVCQNEYTVKQLNHGFNHKGYCREPDRKRAIQAGIRAAKPGDIVLIAGKGHETYQIIGDTSKPFDDRAVAQSVLSTLQTEVDNQ
jgi:UDP-N-acetylmuramoyl-L-alanyl-D-glutamate--2,6-diaminopimelate ligase